jgi:hypothetical protein
MKENGTSVSVYYLNYSVYVTIAMCTANKQRDYHSNHGKLFKSYVNYCEREKFLEYIII